MKSTFRYKLDADDYLKFEKFNLKQSRAVFPSGMMFMFITGYLIYNGAMKKISIGFAIITVVCSIIAFFAALYYVFNIRTKRNVNKYINADKSYLQPIEFSVDENSIEIKNIPQENEAGFVAVYPYSIMRAIFENEDYFYFIIGTEVRILPKSAVPEEMQELVIRQIRRNPKYVLVNK